MITLYNTLTRRKEEFRPLEEGKVTMYVCGPTVYDVPHIGHARSAYIFDVIRRHFEHAGFDVCFARNVTDVDDKIIKKAADELADAGEEISAGRLKQKVGEVAERYLDDYHAKMDMLGIRPPVAEPKATENIPQMIEFIETLVNKGYAYAAGGDVYFSVEKFAEYGKLSGQDREQMATGARVELDRKKRDPLDFALWKASKPHEPYWESPWGNGRPGWHIECSVMSTRIFGAQVDIHGGGLDLIFPHHENEIAQAEAATGRTFANYWVHNGLLTVNGEKMSKSLGNYITVADFLERYKEPDLLKIAFLNSHYRSPMNYSDERIQDAARSRERIMIFFDKVDRMAHGFAGAAAPPAGGAGKEPGGVASLRGRFDEAMDDDFNTPAAMSVMFEAVRAGNDLLSGPGLSPDEKARQATAVKNCISGFADILGLSLIPGKLEEGLAGEIERLVALREDARKKKDYAAADRIRRELMEKGVVIEDTPEGPVCRKT